MDYFNSKKNVQEYMKMTEGFDGKELIEILRGNLHESLKVLELGMGPGKDLELLSQYYQVTGSDNSQIFLDIFKKKNKNIDLLLLDAIHLRTKLKFDGIYSNKVLHHLTSSDLKKSLNRQFKILNSGGILFHSFWYGDKEEEFRGLKFVYYNEKTITRLIDDSKFKLVDLKRYKELKKGDSFYLILKKTT